MDTTLYDIISDTDTQQGIRESLILGKTLDEDQSYYVASLLNFASSLYNQADDNYQLNAYLNNTPVDYRLRQPQRLTYGGDQGNTTDTNAL